MRTIHSTSALLAFVLSLPVAADFDGPAPVAWRWAEATSGSPSGAPQIDGDNVIVAVGGRIYSLDRTDGNQNWRFPAAEPLDGVFRNGVVLAGGNAIAATDKNQIVAVDVKTGALKWQFTTSAPISGTVVVAGNYVIANVGGTELHSFDIATGAMPWTKPLATGPLAGDMSTWQENVIFATNEGELKSVNALTLKENWSVRFSKLSASSSPVLEGDTLYINTGQYLTAMRAQSGGARWQRRLDESLVFSPAASAEAVVVVTITGKVHSFNTSGKPIFGKGVDLGNGPVASPAFVGKTIVQPTSNGAVNLVDPVSGDVLFSYIIPPLTKGLTATTGGNSQGGGRGQGGGGDVGSSGAGGGALGGGAAGGAGQRVEVKYVAAAGPAAVAGNSMLILARDGSLLCFDKEHGVDLIGPEIELLWPNPGDQMSGRPPFELIFRILDGTSGVDPESVKVKVGNADYVGAYNRDGYLSIRASQGGANPPFADGRQTIMVSASDWLGNVTEKSFVVSVDNTLPPLGSPRSKVGGDAAGGGKAGGGGAMGGG